MMTAPNRSSLLGILLVTLCVSSAIGQGNPSPHAAARADAAFALGDYIGGRRVLTEALDAAELTSVEEAEIHEKLARFYEDTVGSLHLATLSWKAVLETDLAEDHPSKSNARKQLARLASYEQQYAEANQILDDARFLCDDTEELQARIADLESVIVRYPDYPQMAKVHHYRGVNLMWLKEYGAAVGAFRRALQLRPGLGLVQPSGHYLKISRFEWLNQFCPRLAWGVLALLALTAVVPAVRYRRWRRLRWIHAAGAALVLSAWCVAFFVLVATVGRCELPKPTNSYIEPIEIHSLPGQSGSKNLMPLFLYGLAATGGSYVFCLGTAGIRHGHWRIAANTVASLAISLSAMTLYYVGHCSRDALLLRDGDGVGGYVRSTLNFHVKDIPVDLPEDE